MESSKVFIQGMGNLDNAVQHINIVIDLSQFYVMFHYERK